jgi:hypothetical protein
VITVQWYLLTGTPQRSRGLLRSRPPTDEQWQVVHAALVDVAEALIRELGIIELYLREPGLERLERRAPTYVEATERLGGLMAHLPDGLHDGAILSAQGAVDLLRLIYADEPMWCSLEGADRLVLQPNDSAAHERLNVLVVGCELAEPELSRIAAPLGLTVEPGELPVWWSDPTVPIADDSFWERIRAAVAAADDPLPLLWQPATHVEEWSLVTVDDLAEVRKRIPPGAMVLLCPSPLRDCTDGRLDELLATAHQLTDEGRRLRCVWREAATGRIYSSLPTYDHVDLYDWRTAVAQDADRFAAYPCSPRMEWPDDAIAAQTPDADGILESRWRLMV